MPGAGSRFVTGTDESTPVLKLFFSVVNQFRVKTTWHEDCELDCRIRGLKKEFAEKFGAPANKQTWYIDDRLLEDDKNLLDYGINNTTRGIIIRVEINL